MLDSKSREALNARGAVVTGRTVHKSGKHSDYSEHFAKQHYVTVAATIAALFPDDPKADVCEASHWKKLHVASRFADVFAKDNARFDRERFLDACKEE